MYVVMSGIALGFNFVLDFSKVIGLSSGGCSGILKKLEGGDL